MFGKLGLERTRVTNPIDHVCNARNISGVVEGNTGSPNISSGNTVPPNDIRTRGNGDTVAFPQLNCMKFCKLILRKIIEIVATRCAI